MAAKGKVRMLSTHDARQMKRMIRLENEHEMTHEYAKEEYDKEFEDPLTGRTVPVKFHTKGKRIGESVEWTDLYRQFQRNGESFYRLRSDFVETMDLLERSNFESPEDFVETTFS